MHGISHFEDDIIRAEKRGLKSAITDNMKKPRQLSFLSREEFSLEETKRAMRLIWEEKSLRIVIYLNLLLIFINFLVLGLFFSSLPPQVPLFYSRPWGEEQLTTPLWLVILPAGSFFVLLLNNFLAIYFIRREKFLSWILMGTSLGTAMTSLIACLKIISLVY